MKKAISIITAILTVCGCGNGQVSAQASMLTKIPENFLSSHGAERKDWFKLDPLKDSIAGISLYQANKIMKGRKSQPVIVAVIDNGVDINHVALQDHLWTNLKEIPGNGIDDDHNGYIDDIHGWNFRGTADGTIIDKDQASSLQYYLAYSKKFALLDTNSLDTKDAHDWKIFTRAKHDFFSKTTGKLDSIEKAIVYNPSYRSADLVAGKNKASIDRFYGSPTWKLNAALSHGTHVAGIITQIAYKVEIMSLVASTAWGDERDEDVANSIRYAVDNGAQIINISFSKLYSSNKKVVDAAVQYAAIHNVLIVHCAGNDGVDIDQDSNYHYPIAITDNGEKSSNFITVGWNRPLFNYRLAHPYGDYGQLNVDLYAPGSDIWSAVPGNGYDFKSGSSMSAPVVTGVAAYLLSYYPKMSTGSLKDILLRSAFRPLIAVNKPQTTVQVPFSTLSATGGIANIYNALQLIRIRHNL